MGVDRTTSCTLKKRSSIEAAVLNSWRLLVAMLSLSDTATE